MQHSLELKEKTRALKAGDKLASSDRIRIVQDIADGLLSRNLRPKQIAEAYGVAYNTANDWLQQAYVILEKESRVGREGLRAIHRGQIERQLNDLADMLISVESEQDKLAIHDRIVKYLDARARTNGLNSEQVDHTHTLKPLAIIRNGTDSNNTTAKPITDNKA